MHPLKQYLSEVEESIQSFGERVGASRQTLYRIMNNVHTPKPALARRIVEATGGAVTLDALYDGPPGAAEIINLNPRFDEPLLDHSRLRAAMSAVIAHLRPPHSPAMSTDLLDVAAEAAAHTYAALSKVTTRQGPARLEQALRPVLEETLKECWGRPPRAALDRGATLAARLYLRADARRYS